MRTLDPQQMDSDPIDDDQYRQALRNFAEENLDSLQNVEEDHVQAQAPKHIE
jgi:hypothetical protein